MSANVASPTLVLLFVSSIAIDSPRSQTRADAVIAVPATVSAATQRTDCIVVKFVEGAAVRLGALGSLEASDDLDVREAARVIGDRRVEPVFTRSPAELARERAELGRLTGRELPDLANYFYVHTKGVDDSTTLLSTLADETCVECCYAAPSEAGIVPLDDIAPTTPLFESRQSYLATAPSGIGSIAVRAIDGALGQASQLLVQLEGAWVFGHEDLERLVTGNIIGTSNFGSYNTSGWRNHGTACVGLLHSGYNGYGTLGLAPESSVAVTSLANGSANMISLATARASAGDVFTSSFGNVISGRHAPADFFQASFDAIQIATAKGICYTFSAGNSGTDLASSIYRGRYSTNAPESGGFIIGATSAGATSRASFSNFGTKVIANGWGSSVATTAYGDLFEFGDDRQDYTSRFSGTSSAAPMVAGVLASLQSAHRRQNGRYLTPDEVRGLLRTTGTAVSGNIGNRPDLVAMMRATGVLDGLRVPVEPVLGGSIGIEVTTAATRVWVGLASASRGSTELGWNRPLLLELATVAPFASGQMGPSGSLQLNFPVPNDSALRGVELFAQVAHWDASAGDPRLTNSVVARVR